MALQMARHERKLYLAMIMARHKRELYLAMTMARHGRELYLAMIIVRHERESSNDSVNGATWGANSSQRGITSAK